MLIRVRRFCMRFTMRVLSVMPGSRKRLENLRALAFARIGQQEATG
jgi:hypothetical protein